jgi:hypothetical protein
MTPPGIEPATFRFVAQYLNHCATAVLLVYDVSGLSPHVTLADPLTREALYVLRNIETRSRNHFYRGKKSFNC